MTIRLALEHPKFAAKESREKGIFTKPFREEPKSNHGEHDGETYKETQTIMETLTVLQNYVEEMSDGLARVNPEAFQMLRAITPRPNLPAENPDFMVSHSYHFLYAAKRCSVFLFSESV
ncbi:unnamed protein product [Dibothriocephalus latus]|uniref:Uncharacterized protein n=1 Tax=Dibothriocephalus latus TaxID=60516 RepID=A0A3P7L5T4_DIBLA|nr:unnamed protein product [Dibothriocephalus latus]